MRRSLRRVCAMVFCVLLIAGCSSGVEMSEVTGSVTLDQTPVDGGTISFYPANGDPTAGSAIEQGKYKTRVPLGISKVEISWPRQTGAKRRAYEDGKSPFIVDTKEAIPAKYHGPNSELTYEVKSGKNEKDFELTTK